MDKTNVFVMGIAAGAIMIWLLWICSILTSKERKYLEGKNPLARYLERRNKAEYLLLDFRQRMRKCDDNIVSQSALIAGFYKRIEIEFPAIAKLDEVADDVWMNRDKVQRANCEGASKS